VRIFHQYYYFLLSTITLLIFTQGCQSDESDNTIAEIGNKQILQSEFISRYEDYILQTGIKDNILSRKEVLNSMISEILLLNFDKNEEIFQNSDYNKEIRWTENEAILGYLKDQEIYAKITVTDEEIRESFLRSNQKLAARHLFASSEEEINNLAELLKIGVDFNTLAKQSFTDSTLKSNGGYLGYFSWGDMDPQFEDKAFSMKVGEISSPIKINNGFSIIKLEDRVTHPLLTEDEYIRKKNKFEQILRIRNKKPSEKNYINNVVDFSRIKFNEDAVDNIWRKLEIKILDKKEITGDSSDDTKAFEYNGKVYSVAELNNKINEIPQYHLDKITSKEKFKTVIKGLILQENLLEIAKEKGYNKNLHVKNAIEKLSRNVFMRFKISEIVENSTMDDTLIYNFYHSNPDFFSTYEKISIQEILVEKLEEARKIKKLLKAGEDFGNLAKKYSIRKATAEKYGIIELTPIKKFGQFQNLFKKSKLNKIIGPLEIENIYGIFRVIDRTSSDPVPYEDAKDIANTAVKFKYKNEILRDYVDSLKLACDINIDYKNLGSAAIFQFN